MNQYFVYIVRCSDDSFYTGVTNNLGKRVNEHNSGLFEGYTQNKSPVKLEFSQDFSDINEAIRAEKQIKGWSRAKKEALISGNWNLLVRLSNHNKYKT